MSDQKRVVVIGFDTAGGYFLESAPDDVVVVLKEYAEGERATDGLVLDHPDNIAEFAAKGVEVQQDVVIGQYGDGTEMRGNLAFVRYVLTPYGVFRPGGATGAMPAEMKTAVAADFEAVARNA